MREAPSGTFDYFCRLVTESGGQGLKFVFYIERGRYPSRIKGHTYDGKYRTGPPILTDAIKPKDAALNIFLTSLVNQRSAAMASRRAFFSMEPFGIEAARRMT